MVNRGKGWIIMLAVAGALCLAAPAKGGGFVDNEELIVAALTDY